MRDLAELMDPELVLPIGGREFRVSCSARQGLHIMMLLSSEVRLDDEQERAEIIYVLGDTYHEMVDAGVSWPKIVLAGRVAMAFVLRPERAQQVWESAGGVLAGNPLPPPPNQSRVGATLARKIFQPREPMDRMILAAARTTK